MDFNRGRKVFQISDTSVNDNDLGLESGEKLLK